MRLTSFCAIGAQTRTLGKANIHAIIQADIHMEKKFSTKPNAFKVVIPEIRNDIIQDRINGNKSVAAFIG